MAEKELPRQLAGRLKIIIATLLLLSAPVFPRHINASIFTGEGAVYFDRGHYWIELPLSSGEEDSREAEDFPPEAFTVIDLDRDDEAFSPSGVRLVSTFSGARTVILSSGKLKGKRCYRVVYRQGEEGEVVIDQICDPFIYDPATSSRQGGFIKRFIAPAFSTEGEYYRLNRLVYGYDLSSDKTTSEIEIEPRFGSGLFMVSPRFDFDKVVYPERSGPRSETARRSLGASVSSSIRSGILKYTTELEYAHRREEESAGVKGGLLYSQSILAGMTVRFDNLFDNVNIDGSSVFKGVDLSVGYAWFDSSASDLWKTDSFGFDSPSVKGRFTWTVLGGFQISCADESFWPSSLGGRIRTLYAVSVRLLLRDMLEHPRGRSYHPDLEFTVERGRRFPLFEFEEKISLGFTFDLYPW
ncbi:MAG: hypothetical protein JW814_00905 [Candidatus Krumholzibacteriota bacterium]|nr:hypothetical protein [Candidatus Krumholzibacteriota bacterium]